MKLKQKIFKIQRELTTGTAALIYDKKREYFGQIPLAPDVAKMMGDQLKIYVRGYIAADGQLHILNSVPPQDW